MSSPISIVLRTAYPCHGARRVRLVASNYAPIEVYERVCPHCGKPWQITRHRMADRAGQRLDSLDWVALGRRTIAPGARLLRRGSRL